MEAKHTQLLNDNLEMTKLAVEVTKQNGEQLRKTDKSVTTVGQDIATLNQTASEILEEEKEHHDVLKGIQENQKVVNEKNGSLLETAKEITDIFENNTETLATIKETIETGNEQEAKAKETFMGQMEQKNDLYGKNIGMLFAQLTSTKEVLGSLDTHDELKQVLGQVQTVTESVNQLDEKRENHQSVLLEEFQKAETDIQSSIDALAKLQTQADELVETFETAVSRIGNIELKLDALSDEEDVNNDTALDVEADETQNQDIEGE